MSLDNTYVATVLDVNTANNNIIVECEDIYGNSRSGWCEPVNNNWHPVVNDEVYISFIEGDISAPIYFSPVTNILTSENEELILTDENIKKLKKLIEGVDL